MRCVDTLVAAVPNDNKDVFIRYTELAASIFKQNGALNAVYCWGRNVPDGEVTSLPLAVRCKPDETVVFGWVLWPSEEVRADGMQRTLGDPRLQNQCNPIPYDAVNAVYGMFEPVAES